MTALAFYVVALAFLPISGGGISAAPSRAGERPGFVERPGMLEFSGQMIVRPYQADALRERGLRAEEIQSTCRRAADRLRALVLEYVDATNEYIVRLPEGDTENSFADRLTATGDYQYVVPNWFCHSVETIPNDPEYWRQWHHPRMNCPLAWDLVTGDPNIVIAIVDGGVELDHPDLVDALVPGYNSKDALAQVDGGDVSDIHGGHGTHVAGVAAAIGNNGSHTTGVGWGFSIMPIRYTNDPNGGLLGDILAGARWAVDHGAKCVNVSQTGVEHEPVQTTGEYITGQGGLLFWAAGNDGRDLSWFNWPDVIVVGATDPNDNRPPWSAYGRAVDVFAPGSEIISLYINGGLGIGSGTSAACPMASGIGALVWAVRPCLPPDLVKECIFFACEDLGVPGNDDEWGWGRVDAFGAVSAVAFGPSSDCDGDGVPDDCQWPRPCPGDLDGDCDVDLCDLAELLGHYGDSGPVFYEDGDLDHNRAINLLDLAAMLGNYGRNCP